jgi:cellulose synthase operon protein C
MLVKECPNRSRGVFRLALTLSLGFCLLACGRSADKFLAKGEEYLQKRKFHDAMMQFRAAAEYDTTSAKAHWGLARTYENLGQFNDTLDELRKTVELDGTNLDAKARLGNYFLLVQPPLFAEAEKLQQEIVEKDPKFVEGYVLKASIFAAQNHPEAEVVGKLNEAIAINPQRTETYISLSRYYQSHDKAAEAEAALQKGISVNPNAALGMTEYGRFLMYAGRNADAEKQFQLATAAEPQNVAPYEAMADFYAVTRQFDKAEISYKHLVEMQENSPESRLELAEFYATAHKQNEAVSTLEQIVADSPEYVLARYRLAQLFLDAKEREKVKDQVAALLKINSEDTEALMLRARLRMLEDRSEDAVHDLESVLKKQPSQRDALFYISQAKLSLGHIDEAKAFIADIERYHPDFLKVGLLKIQAANAAGDTPEALRQANALYTRAHDAAAKAGAEGRESQELQVRALTARGLANLDLGKLPEAKADLEDVARRSPNSSSAVVNLARLASAEKDRSRALGLYDKAMSMDGSNFDALSGYVNVSIDAKKTAPAYTRIDDMIARNADRNDVLAALHYLRSTLFSAEHNAASAETELTTALALDPGYLPAYSAYAQLLVRRNDVAAGIDQYQKAVQASPSAALYTMLGILEDSRGSSAEAEKNYRKALEIAPESPIAANNLAWLITETQGNLDEALQLASMSVAKNPSDAGYYDTLGYVYLMKGLYSPAVEQLKKAVALDSMNGKSANPGYRVRLANALAHAGDKTAARREAETSLQSQGSLSQKEINDARNLLASL